MARRKSYYLNFASILFRFHFSNLLGYSSYAVEVRTKFFLQDIQDLVLDLLSAFNSHLPVSMCPINWRSSALSFQPDEIMVVLQDLQHLYPEVLALSS